MAYSAKIASMVLLAAVFLLTVSGCYPMPKEGEYSAIPTTNNPDVVGSHNTNMLPGGGF